MEFCPKCGSLMIPKNKVLVCRCGFEKEIDEKIEKMYTIEKSGRKREIPIIEEEIDTMPKVRVECKKCGNEEAYYWLLQTRAGDEPQTRFFRCTKCKYTWREYD